MLRERASRELQLPMSFLERLARSATFRYKEFRIPKRSGGWRTVHHPARSLKAVQRWLVRQVVSTFPVHRAATAYRAGSGILENAKAHKGARYTLRLDLANFFPSITQRDIFNYIAASPEQCGEWTLEDRLWFVSIVTRLNGLTIGAPTSPGIANALCIRLDERLSQLSEDLGTPYTRYADDLVFSAMRPNVLAGVPSAVQRTLREIPFPSGLELNTSKTHHASRRSRQSVTGVVLTCTGGLSVGRAVKRRVRGCVHRLESLSPEERKWLSGMLGYIGHIEPTVLNSLALKYGAGRLREARIAPSDDPESGQQK